MEKHCLLSFSLGLNSTSFLIPLRITFPGMGPFLIVKISYPKYLFLYSLRSVALHPHYKINLFVIYSGYYRDPLLVKMQRIRNCQTQRYICNNPTLKLRGKITQKRVKMLTHRVLTATFCNPRHGRKKHTHEI